MWFNLSYIFVHSLQYLVVLNQYWYDHSQPCYICCIRPYLVPQDKKFNVRNWLQFWDFVRNICPKLSEILKKRPKIKCPKYNSPNFLVINVVRTYYLGKKVPRFSNVLRELILQTTLFLHITTISLNKLCKFMVIASSSIPQYKIFWRL